MGLKRNFLVYGLGNMLYTAVVLLLIPVYLEKLNVTDYGIYSIFYVTGNLLSVLFSLSVSNGILRYFSEYEEVSKRRMAVSSLTLLFLALFAVIIGITLLTRALGLNLLQIFKLPDSQPFILLMLGWAFSRIFFNMILGVLRADNNPVRYVILSITDVFTLFLINYFIIYHTPFTVEDIFWGYTISSAISILIGCGFIIRYISPQWNQQATRYMIVYGLPLSIANTISYLITYGNRYFLLYFSGEKEVAVFDVAQKITGLLGIVLVNGFMISFTPYYLSLHKSSSSEEFNERINQIIGIFIKAFFFMGSGVILADNYFLGLLSKTEYLLSSQYTPFLIIANGFNLLFMLLAMTTNINKRTSVEMIITSIMLLTGTSANLLLIPFWGLLGSALSQIIMTFTGFIAINIYNKKYFPLNYQHKSLVISLVLFVGIMIADHYIVHATLSQIWKIALSFLLLSLSCLQFLPYLKTLKHSLQSIIKKKS